jgi:hypothetical protein
MSVRADRRRRLVGDDTASPAPVEQREASRREGDAPLDHPSERRAYAPAAQSALERPMRDLLPSSYGALALVSVGGLLLVGALELSQIWSQRLADVPAIFSAGVFDLAAPHNASRWFAAMLMAATGLVALYLYSLRRHRVDDYHGRYRVWIWTAIACMAVSFGEATSATTAVRSLCGRAAIACNVTEAVLWPALAGTLLAVFMLRILVEVWRCRGSVALLTLAGASFFAAAAIHHGWFVPLAEPNRIMAERGSWLAGYVVLLASLLTYARYVALEIEGKIAVTPRKHRPPSKNKAAQPAARNATPDPPRKQAARVRSDLDPAPEPAATTPSASIGDRRRDLGTAKASGPTEASSNGDGDPKRGLSRKERRRLRREAQMQAQS